ncbi:MAG: amidohydrolase [bacterium]|nr:amidohydrolase [bacterium]
MMDFSFSRSAKSAPWGALFHAWWLVLVIGMVAGATVSLAQDDISRLSQKFEKQTIDDRRWFHENPELSNREFETQAYLRKTLLEIPGVVLIEGNWGTGLVAELKGDLPGPRIAWRADTDGLPITEDTDLPFKSTRRDTLKGGRETGVMHACGHDLHMSIALGAIRILSAKRHEMPGTLMIIFQPAEETGDGAHDMLAAGLFDDGRKPRCVMAFHDHPTIAYGQAGSCSGWSTANVDGFRLTVKGLGGHGAYPHRSIDPVTLAAKMVLAFNDIVSREIDVNHHAVISVGKIEGGTKNNVIPNEVKISATVRTHDEETREAVRDKIIRTVQGLAESVGAPEPELEYYFGTPSGYNDPALVRQVREVFRRVLGPENDITYQPGMGGEDFSRYGKIVPAFQFRLGVAPPGLENSMSLHSPQFNADERAVPLGMRLVAEVLWDQLNR